MPELSPQAQQAKVDAIQGMKDEIAKGVADTLPPDTPQIVVKATIEGLFTQLSNKNEKRKYIPLGDKLIPTFATMEEYGDVAGRAVDDGQQVMGSSWLGQLWTGLRAFFDAIGNMLSGGTFNFAESYAKIAASDISASWREKLAAMSADPEHQKFIQQTNLADKGAEKISEAAMAAANPATKAPEFNLDAYIKDTQAKAKKAEQRKNDVPPVPTGSKDVKISEDQLKGTLSEMAENYLKDKIANTNDRKIAVGKVATVALAAIKEQPHLLIGRNFDQLAGSIVDKLMKKKAEGGMYEQLREAAPIYTDAMIKSQITSDLTKILQNNQEKLGEAVAKPVHVGFHLPDGTEVRPLPTGGKPTHGLQPRQVC